MTEKNLRQGKAYALPSDHNPFIVILQQKYKCKQNKEMKINWTIKIIVNN